ncbi:hypothetical protein V1511DRAFT_375514 [Dipodascopsis uninucleata]
MTSEKSIDDLVQEWLELDQNPETRSEIEALAEAGNTKELELRLRNRIQFGTAGLRSKLQAGFSRMNDLTVLQASQGLAAYVVKTLPDALNRGIVIGHDHRHHSYDFARLTACAFIHKGFRVYYYDKLVHTPLVPFGVDVLSAACGVMITASHNPAPDNGYKVYWSNGCQIIKPHDKGISRSIDENLTPWIWDKNLVDRSELVIRPIENVEEKYYRALARFADGYKVSQSLRIMYTPMHGVGLPYMEKAASILGAKTDVNFFSVPEQIMPDPDFPSIKFPNPEEPGALDLAMKRADERGIKIVLASDPDADRFSAAINITNKGWHQLSGDEIGILFAYFIYHTTKVGDKSKLAMINSTASSQILKAFAEKEGFHYEETLTGFKWIGNKAIDLEKEGYRVPFAYEEAIGYMIEGIHDKDGIGAGVMFIKLLCWIDAQDIFGSSSGSGSGSASPADDIDALLEIIYSKYGYFKNRNSYYISPEPAITAKVFKYIRNLKSNSDGSYTYPQEVGGRKITRWRDLTVGYDSSTSDHIPLLPVSKSSEMITFELDNIVRVTLRGSGTEPKLKVYVEARSDKSMDHAQSIADKVWDALDHEWLRPEETGLLRT